MERKKQLSNGKLGNYIEKTFAEKNKANYLTDKIKALVQYEVYRSKVEGILDEYINYYNSKRPHQGINQKVPRRYKPQLYGKVQKLPILGGLHQHYIRSAA